MITSILFGLVLVAGSVLLALMAVGAVFLWFILWGAVWRL